MFNFGLAQSGIDVILCGSHPILWYGSPQRSRGHLLARFLITISSAFNGLQYGTERRFFSEFDLLRLLQPSHRLLYWSFGVFYLFADFCLKTNVNHTLCDRQHSGRI